MRRLAARNEQISPFMVMELLARARELEEQGRSIVHMEIGEPDFPTPSPVVEAGMEAMASGHLGYTPAAGLLSLRQAISAHYLDRYGVTVPVERIFLTPGASGAFILALALVVETDDQVLMSDPGYPCNRNFVHVFDGEPVLIPVGDETNFHLTAEMIKNHWQARTRGVWLASPANPTGTIIDSSQMVAICDEVIGRGGFLLSDEIYHGLEYDRSCLSALQQTQDAFVVNSFSKYFGMTGWRLGWLIVPEDMVDATTRLAQNLFISAPTHSQCAALAAFSPATLEQLEQRRRMFEARGKFLYHALQDIGFRVHARPQGAFYLYMDCSLFGSQSEQFCWNLLEQAGVAVTPGGDFGRWRADSHIRFAFTTDQENLLEGVDRIRSFVNSR